MHPRPSKAASTIKKFLHYFPLLLRVAYKYDRVNVSGDYKLAVWRKRAALDTILVSGEVTQHL